MLYNKLITLPDRENIYLSLKNIEHNVGSTSVDEARLDGIILGEKELSSIPPSSDALHQKALHVGYQVNYIIIHKYVSHML